MKFPNEAKIGLMVAVVLAILVTLTVKSGDFSFREEGYHVKIHFRNIDGINTNTPVMLNGFEVGHVKAILIKEEPEGTIMELEAFMKANAKLREGTEAYVKNMGFLGEKYVGLTSGPGTGAFLAEGAIIRGKDPADFDSLMADGQEIAKHIRSISINLDERLEKNKEAIDRIVENFDVSMEHVRSVTANLDERLTINENRIDNMMSNFETMSKNLEEFSYDVKLNPWKLLYKEKTRK